MVLTRSQTRVIVRPNYKAAASNSKKSSEAPMGKKRATPMKIAKKSAPPNAPRHQATKRYRKSIFNSTHINQNPVQSKVNSNHLTAVKGAALPASQMPKKPTAKTAAAPEKPRASDKPHLHDSDQRLRQSNVNARVLERPSTVGGLYAVEVRVLSHDAAPVNIPVPIGYGTVIERDFKAGSDDIKISIKRVRRVSRLRPRVSTIGQSLDSALVHRDVGRLRHSARISEHSEPSADLRRSTRSPVPRTAYRTTSMYR